MTLKSINFSGGNLASAPTGAYVQTVPDPLDPGYFQADELRQLGFAHVGKDVTVARTCTIVGRENIRIGDYSRIDSYVTIVATRGTLRIGRNVHVCSGCVIGARGGAVLDDFCSLSHGVKLLSAVDDYRGELMTNSTLPRTLVGVQQAPVRICRFVPVGVNSVILPGVTIAEGGAVAAMSVVATSLPEWTICGGNPAVPLRPRARTLLASAMRLADDGG